MDLAVTIVDGPDPVQVGDQITYTIGVQNNGPDTATGVTLTDDLPAQVSFHSASSSQGAVSEASGIVTANLGTLASGNSATVTVVVTATSTGIASNSPSVTGNEADPTPGNNSATTTTTISTLSADLAVTIVDGPDPVQVGDQITYTIGVQNNGPDTATGVTLTDDLPAQVSFHSASSSQGAVSEAGGIVTANLGTLIAGNSATVTVVVTATSTGIASNSPSVTGNEADPNNTDNTATATTTISTLSADLAVTIVDGPDPVQVGDQITYTIGVQNNGPDTATGVTLTDNLPAQVSYLSATASQGAVSVTGTTVTANLGTLASGNSATVTVVVTAISTGTATNSPSVTGNEADPNNTDNTATATTTISTLSADLAVTIVDGPDPVQVGDQITYTIGVQNNGPDTATGVTLTDNLPAQVSYLSATASQGAVSLTGTTVTANLGTLASGNSATVTVVVTAVSTGTASNSPSVTGNEADPNNTDNTATATTTISTLSADLAVTIVDGPDPVQVGDQITYTIGVQNNGPDTATGVTLTDDLPAQVSFHSASSSQGAVSEAGGIVTANLGTLASGNSATVTVVVTATSTGIASNSPSVTGNEADPTPGNDSATTTTTIFSLSADLLVTASDAPDPATVGSTLTYTFTVTNNGPNTATGVILTDTLPAQVSYLSATASQGTVSETGGTVTATIETLQKGHAATVAIIVNVVTAEDMSNTATVSGNEPDPDMSNNSVTNTTAANQPPSANAGSVQYVNTGDTVQLNGSGSSDPDGDSLTYNWRFVSVPGGSTAAIYPADSATPTFIADLVGDYIIELTVNDGQGGTNSSEVTITASSGDVNQDGKVDAQDTLLAAKISLGLIAPTAYQEKAANVAYPYTVIDARDVVRIAEIALGIPSKSVVRSVNDRSMSTMSHAFHLTCREVTVGERATLTLSSTEVLSGLQAGPDGSLRFDPALIQVEAIRGIFPYNVLVSQVDNNLGEAHFIAIGSTSPRSGSLIEIEFVAIGSGGEATISLALDTILDANGNAAGTAYINGKITLRAVAPLSINHVLNAPNPACNSTEFLAVGQGINEIEVQVYDLSGHLVFTSGWVGNGFIWDMINEEGEQLANGIYLYVVTVRGFNTKALAKGAVRKLVVLR